jgi:hypothetical protein
MEIDQMTAEQQVRGERQAGSAGDVVRTFDDVARAGSKDRRAHRRSNINARIRIAESYSTEPLTTRLSQLSPGGCYLEMSGECPYSIGTTLTATITRGPDSLGAEARVIYVLPGKGVGLMFTNMENRDRRMLITWVTESFWLASDRRRSQRLVLEVPVTVTGLNGAGAAFSEATRTLKVNADGCYVLLSTSVAKGESVTLHNARTKAMLECVVVRVEEPEEPSFDGRREVGLAFLMPNREFWQVYFPPLTGTLARAPIER